MTTLNFLLAHAVARTLQPGDEIVVTQLDHDANVCPWLRIADRPRADGAHAAAAARPTARSTSTRWRSTWPATGCGSWPSRWPPTRSARSPTRAASPSSRTPPARWPGPTRVHYAPHRRIDVAMRSASTCCSARRTSSSARTWASPAVRRELFARWPADRVRPAERDAARATASRRARSPRGAGRRDRRGRLPRLARRRRAAGPAAAARSAWTTRSRRIRRPRATR